MTIAPKLYDADVIVVGAGPCGAFLANLLGQMGLSCLLLERRLDVPAASMAIGVMPPSLQRLSQLGLTAAIVDSGCQVKRAGVYSETSLLGALDLNCLPPPFNYVLSIPQSGLVRILRDKLQSWPEVRLFLGQQVLSVNQTPNGVLTEARNCVTNSVATYSSRYAVACDGGHSPMRTCLGIPFHGSSYAQTFMMGDFPESTPWENEARLFFTSTGSIESFPLPQARRRWVIQTNLTQVNASAISQRVNEVAGFVLEADQSESLSTFTPERYLSDTYFKGRVALCGDAAHVMSPIGGQGMNTGLADAWHLAFILKRLCSTGEHPERLLARYDHCRRSAFNIAANRAARGMWLGTRKGQIASYFRNMFIRDVLFGTSMRRHLAPYFAMLTIPDHDPLSNLSDTMVSP